MYNYQAIETWHDGTLYRSKLEARWAAFFTMMEIPFEYEPFNLRGWLPDFQIELERDYLVEIKPSFFPFHQATSKMLQGLADEGGLLLSEKPFQVPNKIGLWVSTQGMKAAYLTSENILSFSQPIIPLLEIRKAWKLAGVQTRYEVKR